MRNSVPEPPSAPAPQTRQRGRTGLAVAAYLAAAMVLLLASSVGDRYPLGWELLLAPVALPLAAGLIARSWVVLAVAPAPLLVAVAFSYTPQGNPYEPVSVGAALTAASLVVMPVAVAIGRRRTAYHRPRAWLAVMALGLVGLPVAAVQRERTVRVQRDRPLTVDAREGTFRGVGIGDRPSEVREALGRGRSIRPEDEGFRGLSDTITGPKFLGDTTGKELRYGDDVTFLLDRGDRVEIVEFADRDAATAEGLGPGDSLELFAGAYPGLRCEEGESDADNSTPYPYCYGPVAERRFLYVGGTYARPGEPAVVVALSRRPIGG